MSRRVTMGATLALILTSNSLAFDHLIRFAAVFPDGLELPYVFDYTAPSGGFTADGPTRYGPADAYLNAALLAGNTPDAATGIDFSAVTGVLSIGEPPGTLTVLFGADGFADAAPAALAARDFEQSQVEGWPVFARGDDYAISLPDAQNPDPLASGMGKAQRLALGGDFLLRTAGWPEMRAALTALPRPSNDANLWAAMVEGLRAASDENAHLDLASGWSVKAFFDPGPGIEALSDPAAVMKSRSKAAPPTETVVFPFVIFAVTQTLEGAALQIALPFGDDTEAAAAAATISDRLVAHPHTPSRPRVDVQYVEPYSIAVLSLDFAEPSAARDLYSSWMGDIYQRRFQPLTLGF